MNWSDVATAIPAAVVAAVAASPNGLTTNGQVYVAEKRRVKTNDTEAWGFLSEDSPELLSVVLGGELLGWDLELRVGGDSPTDAELESWGQDLRAYFAGRLLSVTGLVSQSVTEWAFEEAPGEGVDRELRITIRFVGFEEPFVTTAS